VGNCFLSKGKGSMKSLHLSICMQFTGVLGSCFLLKGEYEKFTVIKEEIKNRKSRNMKKERQHND
jgi:hypothetical protein